MSKYRLKQGLQKKGLLKLLPVLSARITVNYNENRENIGKIT